jgi:hypothetical protein
MPNLGKEIVLCQATSSCCFVMGPSLSILYSVRLPASATSPGWHVVIILKDVSLVMAFPKPLFPDWCLFCLYNSIWRNAQLILVLAHATSAAGAWEGTEWVCVCVCVCVCVWDRAGKTGKKQILVSWHGAEMGRIDAGYYGINGIEDYWTWKHAESLISNTTVTTSIFWKSPPNNMTVYGKMSAPCQELVSDQ